MVPALARSRASRRAMVVASAAAVATTILLPGTASGPAADHAQSLALASAHIDLSALTLPADCQPSPTGPPGSPYELGLVLQVGHPPNADASIADGTLSAGPISVTGIAASVCGVVKVESGPASCPAQGVVTVPADGQFFTPLTATVNLVPGQPVAVPFKVVPNPINATLSCGSSAHGLVVNTVAGLEGSTGLFSVACLVGPATATLTGSLTSPSSSFSDFTGTLSGPVALPDATVGPTCPQGVQTNLDALVGLPRTGRLVLPVKAALYLPGSAP